MKRSTGLHDLSLTMATRIVSVLTVMGSQVCLAWLLQPSGRGSYAACILFASTLSTVFAVGGEFTATYFVSSKRMSHAEGITYSIIYTGISAAIAILAGVLLMQLPLAFLDKGAPSDFYLALATIPINLFSMTFVGLFTAIRQFRYFALLNVFGTVLSFTLTLVFVWALDWGVTGAIGAVCLAGSLTTVGALVVHVRTFDVRPVRPRFDLLGQMFNYGIRFYFGRLSYFLNYQLGLIILAFYSTRAELGLVAVASQLTVQSMQIPTILNKVLVPRTSEGDDGRKDLVAQCARLSGLIVGILLLGLVLFATPLVSLLFSPKFLPAVPLIQVMAIGFTIRATARVLVPYLLGTDHPGVASMGAAIGMVVNLLLLWVLLPRIGVMAIAVGLTVGYMASSLFLSIQFCRLSGLSAGAVWRPRKTDLDAVMNLLRGLIQRRAA